jgi:hypothetical protein
MDNLRQQTYFVRDAAARAAFNASSASLASAMSSMLQHRSISSKE